MVVVVKSNFGFQFNAQSSLLLWEGCSPVKGKLGYFFKPRLHVHLLFDVKIIDVN